MTQNTLNIDAKSNLPEVIPVDPIQLNLSKLSSLPQFSDLADTRNQLIARAKNQLEVHKSSATCHSLALGFFIFLSALTGSWLIVSSGGIGNLSEFVGGISLAGVAGILLSTLVANACSNHTKTKKFIEETAQPEESFSTQHVYEHIQKGALSQEELEGFVPQLNAEEVKDFLEQIRTDYKTKSQNQDSKSRDLEEDEASNAPDQLLWSFLLSAPEEVGDMVENLGPEDRFLVEKIAALLESDVMKSYVDDCKDSKKTKYTRLRTEIENFFKENVDNEAQIEEFAKKLNALPGLSLDKKNSDEPRVINQKSNAGNSGENIQSNSNNGDHAQKPANGGGLGNNKETSQKVSDIPDSSSHKNNSNKKTDPEVINQKNNAGNSGENIQSNSNNGDHAQKPANGGGLGNNKETSQKVSDIPDSSSHKNNSNKKTDPEVINQKNNAGNSGENIQSNSNNGDHAQKPANGGGLGNNKETSQKVSDIPDSSSHKNNSDESEVINQKSNAGNSGENIQSNSDNGDHAQKPANGGGLGNNNANAQNLNPNPNGEINSNPNINNQPLPTLKEVAQKIVAQAKQPGKSEADALKNLLQGIDLSQDGKIFQLLQEVDNCKSNQPPTNWAMQIKQRIEDRLDLLFKDYILELPAQEENQKIVFKFPKQVLTLLKDAGQEDLFISNLAPLFWQSPTLFLSFYQKLSEEGKSKFVKAIAEAAQKELSHKTASKIFQEVRTILTTDEELFKQIAVHIPQYLAYPVFSEDERCQNAIFLSLDKMTDEQLQVFLEALKTSQSTSFVEKKKFRDFIEDKIVKYSDVDPDALRKLVVFFACFPAFFKDYLVDNQQPFLRRVGHASNKIRASQKLRLILACDILGDCSVKLRNIDSVRQMIDGLDKWEIRSPRLRAFVACVKERLQNESEQTEMCVVAWLFTQGKNWHEITSDWGEWEEEDYPCLSEQEKKSFEESAPVKKGRELIAEIEKGKPNPNV